MRGVKYAAVESSGKRSGKLRFQAEVRHASWQRGQRVAPKQRSAAPADAMASGLLRPRTRCDSSGLGHLGERPLTSASAHLRISGDRHRIGT